MNNSKFTTEYAIQLYKELQSIYQTDRLVFHRIVFNSYDFKQLKLVKRVYDIKRVYNINKFVETRPSGSYSYTGAYFTPIDDEYVSMFFGRKGKVIKDIEHYIASEDKIQTTCLK